MHACCLCVCSACLPRPVAIAIDLSDVAACAKECSSVGVRKQVTQNDRLVAGFIVEDMLPLSTIESPRFRKILDKTRTQSLRVVDGCPNLCSSI